MHDLERLDVGDLKVTDRGLGHLTELHNLKALRMESPDNTANGLKRLAGLTRLESLFLRGSITDHGLQHLVDLKSLEQLYLPTRTVSPDGLSKMRRNLPRLEFIDIP